MQRRWVCALLSAFAMVLGGGALRAEGPAVSDTNVKVTTLGGLTSVSGDRDGVGGIGASVTTPLGHSFGLQFDGGYAHIGDGNFGSIGAHAFWRDPTVGMLGVYTGYSRLDRQGGVDIGRSGVEAQYFAGAVTLDLAGGYEFGDLKQGFGRARLQLYPTDDLMVRAGWLHEDRNFGTIGLEYQVANRSSTGVSLFADTNLSGGSNFSLLGGLKVTFGQSMSLKDRHRRQDPDSYTQVDMQATQKVASDRASQQSSSSQSPQSCPFTPASNVCTRLDQCISAGYIKHNGGDYIMDKAPPSACDCVTALMSVASCIMP